jgi:hypothetical protein
MIILREKKKSLFEMVQAAGKLEYDTLLNQMQRNLNLAETLTTPIGELPRYRFLFDDTPGLPSMRFASLLLIIQETMKRRDFESYFVKTPKGLYVGFVALYIVSEGGRSVVNDVKTFSFGLEDSADENQMYRDLPSFLDKCLAKYGKVSWTAMEGNKANRAYEIYTRRKKGTISKNGKYIRYVCGK